MKKITEWICTRLWPLMKRKEIGVPLLIVAAMLCCGLAAAALLPDALPTAADGLPDDAQAATTTRSSCTVRVTVDGQTVEAVAAPTDTVGDVLEAKSIALGEEDIVWPEAACTVWQELHITVQRVTYTQRTERVETPFETVYRYTNLLRGDATAVYREGQAGVTEITYRDRLVDGKVTESEKVDETQLQQKEDRVILAASAANAPMSAAPFEILLDENGQPVDYVDKLYGSATAYTNDRGLCNTHTSIGMLAQVGVVAVDPRIIPYGSVLYIVSPTGSYTYGYAIAGDTGGALMNGSAVVDLFMNTYEECVFFGRRNMNVYILQYPED